MRVILLSDRYRKSLNFKFGRWVNSLILLTVLVLPATLGLALGLSLNLDRFGGASSGATLLGSNKVDQQGELSRYREQLASAEVRAQQKVQALMLKVAELQARIFRLDAVGERVAGLAGLDKGEFNFGGIPAVGGPEESGLDVEHAEIGAIFRELEVQLDNREQQLNILNDMMGDRNVKRESTVAGLPIGKGWMSSPYGMRTDPFNGRKARHKGVDFAGKEGSDVIAVAAGLVTQARSQSGFGRMVEIDHGDGLVTRYAHNRKNLVKAGDMVNKGQVIAEMGNTGRSTGPHVHFEVSKNGSVVNPARYIHRTTL